MKANIKQPINILLVSPINALPDSFKKNTLSKFKLSTDIKFSKLNVDCKNDAKIENIYKLLLLTKNIKRYSSIIILYPKHDDKYFYNQEQFSALNELFYSKNLFVGGIAICNVDTDGIMLLSEQKNIKKYFDALTNIKNKI